MDTVFWQWAASLGVGGALAWGMFFVYRKDAIAWREQLTGLMGSQRELLELYKNEREHLIGVVRENSTAISANTSTVNALHRRLDRESVRHGSLDAPRD